MIFFYVFLKIVCTSVLASLIRKLRFKPIGNRGIQVSKEASKHKSIDGNIYWKSQILHDCTSQKRKINMLYFFLTGCKSRRKQPHKFPAPQQDFSRTATWWKIGQALPQITWETALANWAPQSSCCCSNIRPVRRRVTALADILAVKPPFRRWKEIHFGQNSWFSESVWANWDLQGFAKI